MNKTTTLIYHEWADLFEEMPPEDVKTVIIALLRYDATGEEQKTCFSNKLVNAVYKMMFEKTQKNRSLFAEKCETNARNGALGGRPRKTENPEKAERKGKEGKGRERKGEEGSVKGKDASDTHTPPSREEVKEFCKAEGLKAIDPERFWNYYTGVKDWRNDRGELIDWQAQARYWNSQDAEAKKTTEFNNFSQRNTDWKALEKELLAK